MNAASLSTRPATDVDPERLRAFLSGFLDRSVVELDVTPTQGGMSNPTYFVTADGWRAVLRKQPSMKLAKSAHAIDREFRVMKALASTGVPVPEVYHYHDDASVIGTPFYLMERIEGRVFADYAMPGQTPAQRRDCYASMCETMASIHRVDIRAAGLEDFGRDGNYFRRQIARWSDLWAQYRKDGDDNRDLDAMIPWLAERVPESTSLALCHGDFRIGNVMFHPSKAHVVGVLDWELSTLGHPLVDVAFNTQAWNMSPDENGGIAGEDLDALGIPPEQDYLEHYARHSGSQERLTDFHRVFAMFRGAVGSAGVAKRGEIGNSTLPDSVRIGRHLAHAYASRGMAIARASVL